MFIHTVYFWLKADAAANAQKQTAQDARELLSKISTVRQLWAGTPAGTDRPVVDNSYAVGLTVVFDDVAGHDVYQDDPLHLEFIARNKENWERVQIYDFIQ